MQSYDGASSPSHGHKAEKCVFPQPATPWLLDGMPWMLATTSAPQPGGVMQFGSNANKASFNIETDAQYKQLKRKALERQSKEAVLPPKQLITEERITMHFSGLQISGGDGGGVAGVSGVNNNGITSAGGLASDDIPSTSTGKTHHHPNPAYQMAAIELEQKLRNANRIVICDELKQAGGLTDAIIPAELLIKSIPRPCTALVPWQPPPLAKNFVNQDQHQQQQHSQQQSLSTSAPPATGLDDYDELGFFNNNNTCNVNLNKADEQMDEDLDL
ncbi:uncharacterized protein LOC115625353 [Scaptodrosophila lebanonensis]|uniref:Uncharacterized protein LOC115625353 n=1 Tax=Drosophila lebanonensis TaxID=7225 RepID=A0A6J2THU1_DROLE|nr:uncharacterized protein LOC115625353 [Scaptodrosophila lebanonensis]